MTRPRNLVLKKRVQKTKLKYLSNLKKSKSKKERDLKDTAKTLTTLKAEHQFMLAQIRRLENTIANLKKAKKKLPSKFNTELEKLKREDKENQARYKIIKEYFERELRN